VTRLAGFVSCVGIEAPRILLNPRVSTARTYAGRLASHVPVILLDGAAESSGQNADSRPRPGDDTDMAALWEPGPKLSFVNAIFSAPLLASELARSQSPRHRNIRTVAARQLAGGRAKERLSMPTFKDVYLSPRSDAANE
jgi:hypothetical protein